MRNRVEAVRARPLPPLMCLAALSRCVPWPPWRARFVLLVSHQCMTLSMSVPLVTATAQMTSGMATLKGFDATILREA